MISNAAASLADSELDNIMQCLLRHRGPVPAWRIHRLVAEVRRLKALEDDWCRGLETALMAGDRESLVLVAQEILAGRNGHVSSVAQVLPEAD